MRIRVELDSKEAAWLQKFIALVGGRNRDPAARFALDSLAERVRRTGGLDLKDLTLVLRIADRVGGLDRQATSFQAVVDRVSAGWHALPRPADGCPALMSAGASAGAGDTDG